MEVIRVIIMPKNKNIKIKPFILTKNRNNKKD